MDPRNFAAIVLAVDAMGQHGSRIGRTHTQKFLFLAEKWLPGLPAHNFRMHIYGPFSNDLNHETAALSMGGVIHAEPGPDGFGERYSIDGGHVRKARERGGIPEETIEAFDVLARWLAPKRVRELEAISTIEFITRLRPKADDETIIERMDAIKPHLRRAEVESALSELREYRQRIGTATNPSLP